MSWSNSLKRHISWMADHFFILTVNLLNKWTSNAKYHLINVTGLH